MIRLNLFQTGIEKKSDLLLASQVIKYGIRGILRKEDCNDKQAFLPLILKKIICLFLTNKYIFDIIYA